MIISYTTEDSKTFTSKKLEKKKSNLEQNHSYRFYSPTNSRESEQNFPNTNSFESNSKESKYQQNTASDALIKFNEKSNNDDFFVSHPEKNLCRDYNSAKKISECSEDSCSSFIETHNGLTKIKEEEGESEPTSERYLRKVTSNNSMEPVFSEVNQVLAAKEGTINFQKSKLQMPTILESVQPEQLIEHSGQMVLEIEEVLSKKSMSKKRLGKDTPSNNGSPLASSRIQEMSMHSQGAVNPLAHLYNGHYNRHKTPGSESKYTGSKTSSSKLDEILANFTTSDNSISHLKVAIIIT